MLADRGERVVRLRVTVYPDADLAPWSRRATAVLADLARVLPAEQLRSRVELSVLRRGEAGAARAVTMSDVRCRLATDTASARSTSWARTRSPAGSSGTSTRGGRRTWTAWTGCSHEHARYLRSPYDAEPLDGLDAIRGFWADPTPFEMTATVIAADGPDAVVRVDVRYRGE